MEAAQANVHHVPASRGDIMRPIQMHVSHSLAKKRRVPLQKFQGGNLWAE